MQRHGDDGFLFRLTHPTRPGAHLRAQRSPLMQHSSKATVESLTALVAPGLFIILWSSGFIGAKYGLPYAEPFTFLAIRMLVVVALLAVFVAIGRLTRP